MATNMAPHNLVETIDASIAYMKNPEINIQELNKIIKVGTHRFNIYLLGLATFYRHPNLYGS